MIPADAPPPTDFIREIIDDDLKTHKHLDRVATRFPPEPNGYLHIGHAKSVCLNFGIALQYGGTCNLRLDDTDPSGESLEFVQSIITDVHWLGFDWDDRLFYASDYFGQLYQFAVNLVKAGKAYVCSLSADEIREYRGTLTEPGRESPYRNRSIEENLDLFGRMRAGEFEDGAHVLRAKIDMASPNVLMRDPIIYRIKRAPHYRTGTDWVIYPMYDFAHCLSDSIERITYSICTLEFENNRPLYDWLVNALIDWDRPQQIEFARLNVSYTVVSKRKLIELVEGGYVSGWDDPRMPTVAGMRRRGYTPESIRNFCAKIGVAKNENLVDIGLLEHCVRDDLNERAPRVMGVLHPLKLVIDNYPEDTVEEFECANHPQNPDMGNRKVPFLQIPLYRAGRFRRKPAKEVQAPRPRSGSTPEGLLCRQVRERRKGRGRPERSTRCIAPTMSRHETDRPADGRKVEGVIHWVSAAHSIAAEVRLYDRLFQVPEPASAAGEITSYLNPASLEVLKGCRVEPSLAGAVPGSRYQFERLAYFSVDLDSAPGKPVLNRIVPLRDSWGKITGQATP